MTRKILITGVGGLLGSRLADWILATQPNTEVIGIDDFSGGYIDNVNPNVKLYTLDLGKESAESVFVQLILGSRVK